MPYDVSRQAMTEYQNAFFAAARKKDQHLSDPELFDGSTLSLFVLRILTDNSDASFSLDDFAFLANRLN